MKMWTRANKGTAEVIANVYGMCLGVKNAAPETHATIVATLVVPSGTGPVLVPGGGSSTTAPSTVLTTATAPSPTSVTLSITPVLTASPTSSPTSTSSSQPSTSTAASTGGAPTLNTSQIAGISVGIAATLFFAIGPIFLARCIRRRNYGDQEAGFYKPKRESKGFGLLKSNQSSPQVLQISAPIHKTPIEMEFKRPGDFRSQQRVGQQGIGLAISPPQSLMVQSTPGRSPNSAGLGLRQPPKTYLPYRPNERTSPGQPSPPSNKPTLTLSIPQEPSPPVKQQRAMLSARTRDSVVTEFQEDGEGESVGGSNIWRPPPTDPQSATTYYVPVGGNWVLRTKSQNQSQNENQEPVELSSPVNRTKAERALDVLPDSPTETTATGWVPQIPKQTQRQGLPKKPSATKLGTPFQFNARTQPRSSSVYSNFSLPQSAAPGPGNSLPPLPAPQTYSALMRENGAGGFKPQLGKPQPRPKSKRYSGRPNRQGSQDSATTIASSVAEPFREEEGMIDELQDSLSSVVESPRTPISPGKSPVSYPRIPIPSPGQGMVERRRQDGIQQQPNPTSPRAAAQHQPAFSLFPRDNLPPPPTLGSGPPGQPSPTLGLGLVGISPLKTRANNPSQPQNTRPTHLNPPPNPAAIKTGSPELRTGSAPPEGQKQRLQPHQHRRQSSLQSLSQSSQQSQQPERRPTAHPLQTTLPNFRLTDATPISATSSGTSSSWLATKRLGADRAAALAFGDDIASRKKWTRDGRDDGKELPATPGWKPKLTPTRRGDDLFLNVQ